MSNPLELIGLQTEETNPRSADIDDVSTLELCKIINNEDATIASAIEASIPTIASAIDAIAPRNLAGGRLIYVGAGTSGRLGVLDASEIPPTYSASPDQFVALIAGGDVALRTSREGAEDSLEGAVNDLAALNIDGSRDSLIGIAASGRTPYVLSSLNFAKSNGCITVGIACTAPSAISECGNVDFMIGAVTGPEVVTGSTRMKAGTATKLVLNMLSTGIMIRTGKTFGNIMVDVKPTNMKLQLRARRILREICGARSPESDRELDQILEECGRSVKLAAAKLCLGVSKEEAELQLRKANGVLATPLKPPARIEGVDYVAGNEATYVLYVDGGGSKCRAIVMSDIGSSGTGEAGPCNASDIGVEAAVAAIGLAVHNAVKACPSINKRKSIRDLNISEAWIGVAGSDRKPLDDQIHSEVTKMLGPQTNMTVRVTNDLDLLATAAGHQFAVKNVIVLVAGTGTIAMRYQWHQDSFHRVQRSGGWGALLGDDGSGFDIGRQAIRFALRTFEKQKYATNSVPVRRAPDPLPYLVRDHFRPVGVGEQGSFDLLSSVLLAGSQDAQGASETKRRIASCAKVVIEAMPFSEQAQAIVQSSLLSLMDLVMRVHGSPKFGLIDTALVLAGGLMQSATIREQLKGELMKSDNFRRIEYIDRPLVTGACYLLGKPSNSRSQA